MNDTEDMKDYDEHDEKVFATVLRMIREDKTTCEIADAMLKMCSEKTREAANED